MSQATDAECFWLTLSMEDRQASQTTQQQKGKGPRHCAFTAVLVVAPISEMLVCELRVFLTDWRDFCSSSA